MMTYERVRVAKEYIEKKYRLKKEEEQEKKKGKNNIYNIYNKINIFFVLKKYRLGRNNVKNESIKFSRRRSGKNKRRNFAQRR